MYLNSEVYYSKVYGCWMGKNIGGTLGAPLEEGWGREELFDVWWYPKLAEGGIPNDDLEIQLIWLQMLQDRGLDITARDFADYWLDCVQYNPDEYGLHKTNLRKGLLPPLSGWYNNWFKDCMGSPIRSEIWACIAPGQPNIAVRYAYQDAILDHAGGESVYGEMFNASIEAAAFVESDREKLLEIGLSYIPENCKTARAVRDAIHAFRTGMDWKEARNYVLQNTWHYNAQYSPVNLGFQTVGWLYGEDFGDAICKAVNCGYDTDCTGATLGAILGIIGGKEALPAKWTEPMSERIATSMENGGLTNVRVPENLDALTRQVMAVGEKVAALNEVMGPDLVPSEHATALWAKSPTAVPFDLRSVEVVLDMPAGPALGPGEERRVDVSVRSRRLDPLSVSMRWDVPPGWEIEGETEPLTVQPGATATRTYYAHAPQPSVIEPENRAFLQLDLLDQPSVAGVPAVFIGANRWLVSEQVDGTLETPTQIERNLTPEGPDGWTAISCPDNAVAIESLFHEQDGILYLRHYVYTEAEKPVHVGFPSNTPFTMWLNGAHVKTCPNTYRLRPAQWGDSRSDADVTLKAGWNQFVIKVERKGEPVQAHFTLATQGPWYHGVVDVVTCRFPWDR